MKRIVVVQGDARGLSEVRAPLSIGVARWRGAGTSLALVVKATFRFAHGGARVIAELTEPEPVCGEVVEKGDTAQLRYPTDFVLAKARCDIALTGHAHTSEPAKRIQATLRITPTPGTTASESDAAAIAGGHTTNGNMPVYERRFTVHAKRQTTAIPLRPSQLTEIGNLPHDNHETPPDSAEPDEGGVGAISVARETADDELDQFDFTRLQAAPPSMQMDAPAPDAIIELEGLSPRGAMRQITLPGLSPRAFVECTAHQLLELPLRCDTLVIDTDFERLTLVWRALLPPDQDDDDIDRVMVALDRADSGDTRPSSIEALLRTMPRGTISFAIEEDPSLEGDPDELEMARHEVLEHPAEPELELAAYATICAELAEDRPRAEVLSDHGYDEHSWSIEERAWSERMSARADRGDGTLTAEFAERFAAAQAALAGPDEPRPLETYADVKRRYTRSPTPKEVLAEANMSLGEWMRLDRHWQERAADEQDIATRLGALLSNQ